MGLGSGLHKGIVYLLLCLCTLDLVRYINLQRSVGLPELRRLRRTFLKLAGQSSLSGPPPPSDAKSAKRMFADYLNRELSANVL
jgi:hypothetical protein